MEESYEAVYTSLVSRNRPHMDYSMDNFSNDPCMLTDEERENMQRKKRKDDAYKTALCEAYRRTSACSYGEQCRFAHGLDELRLPAQPRGRSHPKYKTVLCDKFSNTGYCKYGARCQFIHKITNPLLVQNREVAWKNLQSQKRATGGSDKELPVSAFVKPGHYNLNITSPPVHYYRHYREDEDSFSQMSFRQFNQTFDTATWGM